MGGKRTLYPLDTFMGTRLLPVILKMDKAAYLKLVDPQLSDPSTTNAEPANDDGSHCDRPNGQHPKARGHQSESSHADGPGGGSSCRRRARNGLALYPGRRPICYDRPGGG